MIIGEIMYMMLQGDKKGLEEEINNNPGFMDNEYSILLQTAVRSGILDMVKLILPYSDPVKHNYNSFHMATSNGEEQEIFDYICDEFFKDKNNKHHVAKIMDFSVTYKRPSSLKKLLSFLDKEDEGTLDIIGKAEWPQIIEMLIPYSTKDSINDKIIMAISDANTLNKEEIIDVLFNHCDVLEIEKRVGHLKNNKTNVGASHFFTLLNNFKTKKLLSENIQAPKNQSLGRKI